MKKLTSDSATKLQKILLKHFGRHLTEKELEQAHIALMDFAFALVDLSNSDLQSTVISPQETIDSSKYITV